MTEPYNWNGPPYQPRQQDPAAKPDPNDPRDVRRRGWAFEDWFLTCQHAPKCCSSVQHAWLLAGKSRLDWEQQIDRWAVR